MWKILHKAFLRCLKARGRAEAGEDLLGLLSPALTKVGRNFPACSPAQGWAKHPGIIQSLPWATGTPFGGWFGGWVCTVWGCTRCCVSPHPFQNPWITPIPRRELAQTLLQGGVFKATPEGLRSLCINFTRDELPGNRALWSFCPPLPLPLMASPACAALPLPNHSGIAAETSQIRSQGGDLPWEHLPSRREPPKHPEFWNTRRGRWCLSLQATAT